MHTRPRFDITPKPAEFNVMPRERRVTIPELLIAALSLGTLLFTVATVADPWSRAAGVLLLTGLLSAFIARRAIAVRGCGV